jgi:hypothetical protein
MKTILQIAEEEGFVFHKGDCANFYTTYPEQLERFAARILAEQKEKCSDALESEKVDYATSKDLGDLAYNTALDHGIAAIRNASPESDIEKCRRCT